MGTFLSGNVSSTPVISVLKTNLMFWPISKVCFAYYQQSLISPPEIPRYFMQIGRSNLGQEIDLDSVFDAHCSISVHLYQLSSLQRKNLGYTEDLQERRKLYKDINAWLSKLPPPGNYPAQIRYLHYYLRQVIISATLLYITMC